MTIETVLDELVNAVQYGIDRDAERQVDEPADRPVEPADADWLRILITGK